MMDIIIKCLEFYFPKVKLKIGGGEEKEREKTPISISYGVIMGIKLGNIHKILKIKINFNFFPTSIHLSNRNKLIMEILPV